MKPSGPMFKYYDEFYKPAIYHFIISAGSATLYALGLDYSKGSNGDSNVPYFISALVLSALHFILCVLALLVFCMTRRSPGVDRYGSRAYRIYGRLKSLYFLTNMLSFLWSIIGAAITGSAGICAKEENKCYYTVNVRSNRAIAIVIVVLHIWNGVASYIILATPRSSSKPGTVRPNPQVTANRKIPKVSNDLKPGITRDRVKDPGNKESKITETNKQTSKLKTPLRRHQSEIVKISRSSQKNASDTRELNEVKPLPRRNKKLLFPAVGKLVITWNATKSSKNRRLNTDESRAFQLAETTSTCSSSSAEENKGKRKRKILLSRLSTSGQSQAREVVPHPPLPPPSYEEVVSNTNRKSGANPYWLPPGAQGTGNLNMEPANIYSGTSFPDTDLVVVEPSHISERYKHIR